jgi:hypothetical protein
MNLTKGDLLEVIGGTYKGRQGQFIKYANDQRISVHIVLKNETKSHCLRSTSVSKIFNEDKDKNDNKRARTASDDASLCDMITPASSMEGKTSLEDDIRLIAAGFCDLKVTMVAIDHRFLVAEEKISLLGDRVAALEAQVQNRVAALEAEIQNIKNDQFIH